MDKVFIVFQDNGLDYEDNDYFVVKVFSSKYKAQKFKNDYKPKKTDVYDHEPRVWVESFDVE